MSNTFLKNLHRETALFALQLGYNITVKGRVKGGEVTTKVLPTFPKSLLLFSPLPDTSVYAKKQIAASPLCPRNQDSTNTGDNRTGFGPIGTSTHKAWQAYHFS